MFFQLFYIFRHRHTHTHTPTTANTHTFVMVLAPFELVTCPKISHDGSLRRPAKAKSQNTLGGRRELRKAPNQHRMEPRPARIRHTDSPPSANARGNASSRGKRRTVNSEDFTPLLLLREEHVNITRSYWLFLPKKVNRKVYH